MKIICAWCGTDMGEKDGEGIEGVSHSLCQECLEKLEAKTGNGKQEQYFFLNLLGTKE